ncbi:MAG TPA: DUF2188 domain-containing protein [Thermoanaerobaculia bacterium]
MAARNQHVVPHPEGWAIQSEGSKRITAVFSTKREAIDKAEEIANRAGTELIIHGRHGQPFYSTDTPGQLTLREMRAAMRAFMDNSKRTPSRRGRTRQPG